MGFPETLQINSLPGYRISLTRPWDRVNIIGQIGKKFTNHGSAMELPAAEAEG
jgi:hypothetical protein